MLDDFQDDDTNQKGREFLDEFRQRLNSQPLDSLEERKNDINRSQHIFLGTVLGIGLAGIVSWFILSPNYSSVEDAEIPVVRRPQAAIKVQPADPGGMEILNQDKTVYDIVEKKQAQDNKVENLLPPPEEPKLILAEEKIPDDILKADADSKVMAQSEQKIDSSYVAKTQTAEEQISKQPEVKQEVKIEIKAPAKTAEAKPKPAVKAKVESAPTAKAQANIAPSGSWQIQLISSPNKSAMDKAWADLSKKYSALKGLPHEVEAADLGAKGTFYRLKAGAFKERTDADKICNSIKSAGGSCLVKKK